MKDYAVADSAAGRYPGPAEEFHIAEVLRPHGVKGAFHVNLFAGEADRLKELEHFDLVDPADDAHRLSVTVRPEDSRPHARILAVDAWTTPEEVRAHHHWLIAIPRSEAQELQENEYYLLDLVGLEVQLPSGQIIGRVTDVNSQTAQPILVIGAAGAEDFYLPAVREMISWVSLEEGLLVIDPTPGLIELYRLDIKLEVVDKQRNMQGDEPETNASVAEITPDHDEDSEDT